MIIRIVLVACIGLLLVWVLNQTGSIAGQAKNKLLAIILFGAAILAVLFPDVTNIAANAVGVGRGADLLLYSLTVAFLASIFLYNLARRKDQQKITQLSRKLAIIEANQEERNRQAVQAKKHAKGA